MCFCYVLQKPLIVVVTLMELQNYAALPFSVCLPEEPPVVNVDRVSPDSENTPIDNDPVLRGGTARLRCVPVAGVPIPALAWESISIPESNTHSNGDNIFFTARNLQASFCLTCTGRSAVGQHSHQQCITVSK